MATSELTLKLLVDMKNHKVLFAEAEKDFVDFLFALLALPLATVTSLLETKNMVGSIGDVYDSIQNLSQNYIIEGKDKNSVLKPTFRADVAPLLLPSTESFSLKAYACAANCNSKIFSKTPKTSCPFCGKHMSVLVDYDTFETKGKTDKGGFVKSVVTYMVMDNLKVTPMSTVSSISLLQKFNINELNAVQEKVVGFGLTESLKLLKASLQTKSVLTSIFLEKEGLKSESQEKTGA